MAFKDESDGAFDPQQCDERKVHVRVALSISLHVSLHGSEYFRHIPPEKYRDAKDFTLKVNPSPTEE